MVKKYGKNENRVNNLFLKYALLQQIQQTRLGLQNTPTASLQKGKSPLTSVAYDTK